MSRQSDLKSKYTSLCINYLILNQKVRFIKKMIPLLKEAWDQDIAFFNSLSELVYTFLNKTGIYHSLNFSEQQSLSDIMKKAGYDPAVFVLDKKITGVFGIYVDTGQPNRGIPFHIQMGIRKRELKQNSAFRKHTLSQFQNVQSLNFWRDKKIHTVQLLYPEFEEPMEEYIRDLKLNFSGDSAELAMFMAILYHFLVDESPLKNLKIFATGKIKADGTIQPVNSLPEKMKIILEEYPDLDLVYLSKQQKDVHPENYPAIRIFFVQNISEIWQYWKEHISPVWFTNSLPFLNHEIRFLRHLADFQSGYHWISPEQVRIRFEELIQLGFHYIKNSGSRDELSSKEQIERAAFLMNVGYYYNHYGNLQHAEKAYQEFLRVMEILEQKGDITEEILHGLNQIAIFYRDIYDYRKATSILDNIMNSKKFHYLPNIEKATWYRSRALIALDLNDLTLAKNLLIKSAKIAKESKDSLARQRNLEMELFCKSGDEKKARNIYHSLLKQFYEDSLNSPFLLLYILKYYTRFKCKMDSKVQNVVHDLLWNRINYDHYIRGMILHWYARWCAQNRNLHEALFSLNHSTESFRKLNSPDTNLLALGNQWLKADLQSDNKAKKEIEKKMLQINIPSIAEYLKSALQSSPKFLPEILHF